MRPRVVAQRLFQRERGRFALGPVVTSLNALVRQATRLVLIARAAVQS